MKKLMIAAIAICAAIAANAANSIIWGASDVYKDDGSSDLASNYLVYYVDAATYSHADAEKAIGNGDISFLSLATTYKAKGTYEYEGLVSGSTEKRYNGEMVSAYAVVLNAASEDDATKAYLSGVATDDSYIEFGTSETQISGNWKTVSAVPEPTSGLLMLMGGMLLGLRRKRV